MSPPSSEGFFDNFLVKEFDKNTYTCIQWNLSIPSFPQGHLCIQWNLSIPTSTSVYSGTSLFQPPHKDTSVYSGTSLFHPPSKDTSVYSGTSLFQLPPLYTVEPLYSNFHLCIQWNLSIPTSTQGHLCIQWNSNYSNLPSSKWGHFYIKDTWIYPK